MSTENHEYEIDGEVISSKNGAEIFNDYQHNIALGDYSHAEGSETIASGPYSHAEGGGTKSDGLCSHAEGGGCTASGSNSHAEGSGTNATGGSCHSEGGRTIASGSCSHAEGSGSNANGNSCHAEGSGTKAGNDDGSTQASHAEGSGSRAVGSYSHAEGSGTRAFGAGAHSEGGGTSSYGSYSHSEGGGTSASGDNSHAEGGGTIASGAQSHSEGSSTKATADNSHAEGQSTISASPNQHVQGKYNVEDTESKYAFIIGNGTSNDNRSNAIAIDWDGNIICYGDEISINEQIDNNTRKLSSIDDNANNYIHPTHTSHSKSMYKFANDGLGHISDAEPVTKDDIVELGIPGRDTTYTAGTGLSISGTTINHKNSVTAKTTAGFVKVKYDSQGHITGSSGVTKDDIVDLGIPGKDTNTKYIVLRGSVKTNHGYIGGVNSLLLVDKSNYDKENEVLTSTNDLSICDMNPYVTFFENHSMNPEYTAYPIFYDVAKSGEKSGIQSVISSGKIRINQNLDGFDVDGNITASKFIGANATKTEQGLMSAKDKTKLDNIADSANNYVHPTTSGNKHIPSGGSSGQILRWSADGTAVWGDDKDTKYSNATQSASGLMTAEDKTKLDGIAIGANKTVIDTALSSTSTNPVQNKVVKAALDGKAASSHTHSYLPLSGGTMTGNATVSKSSGDAGWYAERSDTGVAVWCGVGSGGTNHGVYSKKLNKWMMYGDASDVYLNGNASTATKLQTARTINGVAFDGSKNITVPLRSCYAYDDSSTFADTPWHKVASISLTGTNVDRIAIFHVDKGWTNGGFSGILRARIRVGSTAG